MDKFLAAYLAASYQTVLSATKLAFKYVVWINAQSSESAAIQALLDAATKTENPTRVLSLATAALTANVPTVTSASAVTGTTAGGDVITLTGTHLLGVTGVTFGGTAATAVKATSDTTLVCTTPAKTAGAKDVIVTTTAGSVTKTNFFTYA